jgi:riboflavin kinase/FMN adenylyltransferase
MQVEDELASFSPEKEMLLAIGVFDGVHLGHKYLISKLIEQAKQRNLVPGVVTFRQHPRYFLSPKTRLPYLTDLAERTKLLKDEGVEYVIPLSFNDELSRLSARQFIGLLQKYLKMRGLVIGQDFALGRNREGDADMLGKLGQEMGFTVTVVPLLEINGGTASSTAIRKAIASGDMRQVKRLAGHPFSLHGRIVTGAGRGTGLGFPTANLDVNGGQAIPADGVYVGWAHIGDKVYRAISNIGKCPTFDGCERTVEAYVLDYHDNLYGQELKIDFVERLRDEKKFENAEELKKQIAEDVERGKAILNSGGGKQK